VQSCAYVTPNTFESPESQIFRRWDTVNARFRIAEKPRCWIDDQRGDSLVEQERCCCASNRSNLWRFLNLSSSSGSKRRSPRQRAKIHLFLFFSNAPYFCSDIRDIKCRRNLPERLAENSVLNPHPGREKERRREGEGEGEGEIQHSEAESKGKANCTIFQTKRANRRNVVDVREWHSSPNYVRV